MNQAEDIENEIRDWVWYLGRSTAIETGSSNSRTLEWKVGRDIALMLIKAKLNEIGMINIESQVLEGKYLTHCNHYFKRGWDVVVQNHTGSVAATNVINNAMEFQKYNVARALLAGQWQNQISNVQEMNQFIRHYGPTLLAEINRI
jgi:hypothetical protein